MDNREDTLLSADAQPRPKRRRIRRGTRSCWECKRRKVRCTFASSADRVCVACRRRSSTCIDQEQPEEQSRRQNLTEPVEDQMVRVEALLKRLVENIADGASTDVGQKTLDSGGPIHLGFQTPTSEAGQSHTLRILPEQSPDYTQASPSAEQTQPPLGSTNPHTEGRRYRKLSEALHAALPSQSDLDILYKAEHEAPVYFLQCNTRSNLELEQDGFEPPSRLWKTPRAQLHPVSLAKRMLYLAIFMLNIVRLADAGLSEQPLVISYRLADTAIRSVVRDDDLAGTMDHLECQMLEGTYHWGRGSIRRAWLSWRKALLFAQSLGLHRHCAALPKTVHRGSKYNVQTVWFRIVYMDRFFSLMLRLPQGTPDVNVGCEQSPTGDTLNRRLQGFQAAIAARILERNERDPALLEYSTTQDIDAEILKAVRCMPPVFWAAPNFDNVDMQSEAGFWKSVRMVDQVFHYTLLIMLHLPYLLRFDTDTRHEYSRLTCVNAGRDSMLRYTAFRNSNATIYCRPANFFALVASITVLIGHLHSHRNQQMTSTLAHQRLGDRAIVGDIINQMDKLGRTTDDLMSVKSAELLRRLLDVEESASQGHTYRAQIVEESEPRQEDEWNVLQVSLPYFGLIRITHEDTTLEVASDGLSQTETRQSKHGTLTRGADISFEISHENRSRTETDKRAGDMLGSAQVSALEQQDGQVEQLQKLVDLISATQSDVHLPGGVQDSSVLGEPKLSSSVGGDEGNWAFAGVDTAFFGQLMNKWNSPSEGENGFSHMVSDWNWDVDEP